ncbi:MAG: prepilin peptidase, partial [Caldanaerobacter sp.]
MEKFIIITVILVSLISSFYDIRYRIIPNKLTYPTIAGSLVVRYMIGGSQSFVEGIKGTIAGFLLMLGMYMLLGGIGEGDIKLLSAFGAICGPFAVLKIFTIGTIIGGIYSAYLI